MRHLFVSLALLAAACLPKTGVKPNGSDTPHDVTALTLVGQFSIPPLTRYPSGNGPYFGGISGLAAGTSPRELFGVSDAHLGGRVYRLALDGLPGQLNVSIRQLIPLQLAPGENEPDPEALARERNGNFIVASEGSGREPRRPPTIVEHGRLGEFVRSIPVRDRYVPEVTGPLTRGARGNAGFESLTLTERGDHLFVATETALVQDGEPANFEAGTRTRILKYERHDGGFEPGREFAYEIDRLDAPDFKPGFFINGLVELLPIDMTTLLALERGYVADAGRPGFGVNRIRIYKLSLAEATDISAIDSLKGRTDIVPVKKTVVLDLSKTPGLSPDLQPALDNFEGMTYGPRLPDGRRTIVIVSDDNFNELQRTWFLVFAIQ
ncbi:MAG TPA: esterase-like activity of phytase family protein [Vicinamibacterales bacterium]|nr:esterase-like activity of phytase family protein [Vicinamibacterales bacterium]